MIKFIVFIIALLAFETTHSEARNKRRNSINFRQNNFDESKIQTPGDGTVCFSPIDPCEIMLKKFMASAQKSIDVMIFDLNLDSIANELIEKSKTIPVRVLVDKRQAKEKKSLARVLMKAGIVVKFGHQKSLMHSKVTIIDSKIIETGSFNYTNNASKNNNENQVYLGNPEIVKKFNARFEALWNESSTLEPM